MHCGKLRGDWLIDWLSEWVSDWLSDGLSDWLIEHFHFVISKKYIVNVKAYANISM